MSASVGSSGFRPFCNSHSSGNPSPSLSSNGGGSVDIEAHWPETHSSPLLQSSFNTHALPSLHFTGHGPPQSTSASPALSLPSEQISMSEHVASAHLPWLQNLLLQFELSLHSSLIAHSPLSLQFIGGVIVAFEPQFLVLILQLLSHVKVPLTKVSLKLLQARFVRFAKMLPSHSSPVSILLLPQVGDFLHSFVSNLQLEHFIFPPLKSVLYSAQFPVSGPRFAPSQLSPASIALLPHFGFSMQPVVFSLHADVHPNEPPTKESL